MTVNIFGTSVACELTTTSKSWQLAALNVSVCVCERERESVCVCECVMRVEREGVHTLEFEGQNSCDHFETVLHPATKPSPSLPPGRGSPHYTPTCSMASTTEWRCGAFELRPETEEGTNRQTKTSPTVYRSYSNTR